MTPTILSVMTRCSSAGPGSAGTHPGLEPTALWVPALHRAGLGDPSQDRRGYRLDPRSRHRQRAGGTTATSRRSDTRSGRSRHRRGWHLLALALSQRDERTPIVASAIRYFTGTLPTVRASASLGWGLLGLRAWSASGPGRRLAGRGLQRATGRPRRRMRAATPVVLVDVHAEATSEKIALARWLDGRVTAVIGTHTHVQTADARVQPGRHGRHHRRRHEPARTTTR